MLLRWVVVAVLFSMSDFSIAENVYYGGFSYLGHHNDIEKNYPYTSSINTIKSGVSIFDIELSKKIEGISESKANIILSDLADIKDENALAATLALESELTSIDKIDGIYKILIQMSAQILIFNYSEMKRFTFNPFDTIYP